MNHERTVESDATYCNEKIIMSIHQSVILYECIRQNTDAMSTSNLNSKTMASDIYHISVWTYSVSLKANILQTNTCT